LKANGVYELVSDVTDADENGEFGVEATGKSITGLISGTYKLEEVKAPDGYIISNKETIFNVQAGSDVTTVITLAEGTTDAEVTGDNQEIISIINKEGLELPNTGGIGTLPYTLGGLMILGAAVMFGFILRRRRGRRLYE
jgi:LPXTG-motif cell wall-anchored protein